MPKYRITTNGIKFRVEKKVFGLFWRNVFSKAFRYSSMDSLELAKNEMQRRIQYHEDEAKTNGGWRPV